jgi:adenylate cyclase
MVAIADFAHKFGLVLKACNISRGRLAQAVGIDKSVVSRWASGVQTPTDQNLTLLTEVIGGRRPGFCRSDWELSARAFAARLGLDDASAADKPLALPDKPSIAVLPFHNMSGDPQQDDFADGMVEDIITALSRFRSLFVIARNSTFTYKGRAVDVRTVARELGVRYVVEGSVRRIGNRVRITAQLIDATTGHHVWSERYDRQIEDVFEFQDEMSRQIVSAINVELIDVEAKRPRQKQSGRLDVWELYHRGVRQYDRSTRDSNNEARRLFEAAISADPNHAMAHAGLACTYISDIGVGLTNDPAGAVAHGLRHAQRAVELDVNDALPLAVQGRLQVLAGDTGTGVATLEKAIALNPNLAYGFRLLGEVYAFSGRPEDALRALDIGMRLSPRDPGLWVILLAKSNAYTRLGDHARSIECARRAIQERPDQFWTYIVLAIVLAFAERLDEARVQVEAGRRLRPDLSSSTVREVMNNMKVDTAESIVEMLRLVGLPD